MIIFLAALPLVYKYTMVTSTTDRRTVNMLLQDSVFDWNSMASLNTKEGIMSEEAFEQVAMFVSDTLSRRRQVSTDKKEQPTTHRRRANCTREERGQLYGLYKQATIGDNNTDRPNRLNLEARLKWKAWSEVQGLSKEDARQEYCDLAKKIIGEPVEDIIIKD